MLRRLFLQKALFSVLGLSLFGFNEVKASNKSKTDFLYCAIVDDNDLKTSKKYRSANSTPIGNHHTFYYECAESTADDCIFYSHGDIEVFLDKKIVSHCLIANTIEGWVECFRLTESGKPEYILADYQVKNPPGASEDKYYNIMVPKLYRTYGNVQILKKKQ